MSISFKENEKYSIKGELVPKDKQNSENIRERGIKFPITNTRRILNTLKIKYKKKKNLLAYSLFGCSGLFQFYSAFLNE